MFSKSAMIALSLACASLFSAAQTLAYGGDDGGKAGVGIADMNTWRVASGLQAPLFATAPPGDLNRLFIVEQGSAGTGRIRLLNLTTNPPTLQAAPYLSISGLNTGGEQGLLGLAFHPDFATNGYFWVYYTNPSNTVARYRANVPYDTSTSAAAGGTVLLSITDPFSNHNGGWIAFAPNDTEGYLYVATGDGGSANDPGNRAQNINDFLGKMLRIDIDGADNIPANDDDDGDDDTPDSTNGYTSPASNPLVGVAGLDQIWAIGLRNPWRNAFDRATNDLYIADVGQNAWEEIDFQPASSAGGENYGWRCMEGNACTGLTGCTCNAATLTDPIHVYGHGVGCSVTGGYVYRGSAISGLAGTYFFADYCSATIWSFKYLGAINPPVTNRTAELAPGGGLSIGSITSFGEDGAGEMYIVDQAGEVFKIVPAPTNNTCATATAISDGAHPVNSITATTDGFAEPSCGFTGSTQIDNDVWFAYTATCTGTARASLCGANFNSRIAIYGAACPTAGGMTIACNDDFCGTASEVTWPATMGEVYRIRVGGNGGTTGTASMIVSCDDAEPPCADSDIDNDGEVEIDDLFIVVGSFGCGANPGTCPGDVDGDGDVDIDDLFELLAVWGPCA